MNQIVIWTIVILAGLGLLLAVVLYLVALKFKVEEDPRIEQIAGRELRRLRLCRMPCVRRFSREGV